MKVPLTTIFSWFEKGDIPTEYQFRQTFSLFRHLDDEIEMDDVKSLNEAFQKRCLPQLLQIIWKMRVRIIQFWQSLMRQILPHNLGTRNMDVIMYDNATFYKIEGRIKLTDPNKIDIEFDSALPNTVSVTVTRKDI